MRLKRSSPFSGRCLECGSHVIRLAGCLLLCLLGGEVRGAETNTNGAPTQAVFPQSVFATEGATGKDPFFPNSTRRIRRDDSGKQPATRDLSSLLKLTGIAGGVRPIATINNLTFAVGEEQEVKVEGGKARIRVLEIREKSVIIAIARQAQPIELKLRDVNLKFDE
jgi:hypothetical protein